MDADLTDEALLYGHDPAERIVALQAVGPGTIRLYRRLDVDRVETEDVRVHPFFFLSDIALLTGFPRDRYRFQELAGAGFFRQLVVFPDRNAYWDALRHVERATETDKARPDEVYLPGSPEQQYLMQTGRTLFKGMAFEDLKRLQLDIEVYSPEGFPQAEVPEHRIILVALSDSTGWSRLVGDPSMREEEVLRETLDLVKERDPDVIEGHNCVLPGSLLWTLGGPIPVERVGPTCAYGSAGLQPVPSFTSRPYSGEVVTLWTERGGALSTTPDHPHLVARSETTAWTPAGSVRVGDYVAGPRRLAVAEVEEPLSEDDFYAAGLIWSDGHVPESPNLVWFSNTDPSLLDWMREYMGDARFEKHRKPARPQHAPLSKICLSGPKLRAKLEAIGVPRGDKLNATLDFSRVLRSPAGHARAFLRGVIDGDGHVRPDGIVIASASPSFRAVIRQLVARFGLQSTETAEGVRAFATEDSYDDFDAITGGLVAPHKRVRADRTRALRDDLPPEVASILKGFFRGRGDKAAGVWGLDYADVPLPRTTVSYVLNRRTRISRRTARLLCEAVDRKIGTAPVAVADAWRQAQRRIDGLSQLSWYRVRRVERADYDGPVYNTTTPDHTYVVDGLLTHNCYNFDLPYLFARCRRWGVPLDLGRDGSEPRTFPSSMRFAERQIEFEAVELAGRHVIDTLFQVMAFDVFKRDLPNYTLKGVAKYFGFAPEGRTYVPGDQIAHVWDTDPHRLMEYAIDDATETERIARHLSGSTFYLTQMVPMPYGQGARTGPAAKIEALFVRAYLHARHSLPRADFGSQVVGGYTDVFVTGVVGPVVYADVESLYPSIMLNYDVQPKDDALGIFPRLLRTLTDLRFETKGAMQAVDDAGERGELDARQSAYKIVINSFYGNMGFGYALFNDFAEADRVAATGQDLLRQIMRLAREAGARVIEVDTDGVLFVPPEAVRGEEAERAFVADLSAKMPEGIRIGFDGRFQKMMSYKKKNYALLGYDGSITFKGSSLVSRSSERFGRRFVRRAIRLLLDEDVQGLHDLYLDVRRRIVAHDWDGVESFQRVETLKSSLEEYERDVADGSRTRSAAYEVARRTAERTGRRPRRGDRVAYYIAEGGGRAFEAARLAELWDARQPDEDTAAYLDRLDQVASKFLPFFASESQFRLVFSEEDLFGFDPSGIELRVSERAPEEVEDDVPF